jgi:hypothetical protein
MADVTSPFGFPYPEDTDLVRDGASDIENLAEGVNDYLAGGYLYAGTRYYTSSGSFAKADPLGTGDIGLRAIRVRMVGGGGGSGSCRATTATQGSGSGGGAGGGYAESFVLASALTASVSVVRGSGGSGGAAPDTAGSAGGASSFGSGETFEVSAVGGGGGDSSLARTTPSITASPAAGGAGGVGDLVIVGGGGGAAILMGPDGFPSNGGSSFLSQEQEGFRSASGVNGVTGRLYGGGARGSINTNNQAVARNGGTGAAGIVIVDCFV